MFTDRADLMTITSINNDNRTDKKKKIIEEYPLINLAELNYIINFAENTKASIQFKVGTAIGNIKKRIHNFFEDL
jgi:hypothetical protein